MHGPWHDRMQDFEIGRRWQKLYFRSLPRQWPIRLALKWGCMLPRSLAVLVAISACAHDAGPGSSGTQAFQPSRHRLDLGVNGLSGLARDGDLLWTVAERGHRLVAIDRTGLVRRTLEITALPTGYDLESVAHLGPSLLAVGSETSAKRWQSHEGRTEAKVFILTLGATEARVTGEVQLPFSLWQVAPKENQGIEGLCHASGTLVAGIETVIERDGRRFAPLATKELRGGSWRPYLLALTSTEGKLSSLDCTTRGDAIEVVAVERHFGVMRILRFQLNLEGRRGEIVEPRVVADLSSYVGRDSINIEGIAQLENGSFAMIVDNEFKTISGPNELVVMPATAP